MMDDAQISADTALLVRDTCMCLALQRAARRVARAYDEALRPVGLTNRQFSLLMLLVRPDPPTIGELASDLVMDRTSVTAALKPLEQRGLLAIEESPDDRRSRRPRLTGAGLTVLRQALPHWRAAQADTLKRRSPIPPGDLKKSLRALSE